MAAYTRKMAVASTREITSDTFTIEVAVWKYDNDVFNLDLKSILENTAASQFHNNRRITDGRMTGIIIALTFLYLSISQKQLLEPTTYLCLARKTET